MNIIIYLGGCPLINGVLPTVSNSYPSNVNNIRFDSDGTILGYYDLVCVSGYSLDTNIGGRITCLTTNSWSQPLPQCNGMLFHSSSN